MMLTAVRADTVNSFATIRPLDFMWLELTNQCNLNCLHCYSESSPQTTHKDLLKEEDYRNLISQAAELGCQRLQFIGGEPTLNPSLIGLIDHARSSDFELIEVFTNLVNLPDNLFQAMQQYRVSVATSFYAASPQIHDGITRSVGSHRRTLRNIKRLVAGGIGVRASVITMKENAHETDATVALLNDLGVHDVGIDHVRNFGRADLHSIGTMQDLCGKCASNILAIGPDGTVAPCIMAKQWQVGSVLNMPFRDIAVSHRLTSVRHEIEDAIRNKGLRLGGPYPCQPDQFCQPNCAPNANCGPCTPYAGNPCGPNRWCNPAT